MAATLTSVNAALEVTWTSKNIVEQLFAENQLLDLLGKRRDSTQVGLQAQTPIHTDRNWGFTALPAAGGTLNAAQQQGFGQATWAYAHETMQIAVQGSAIDGTENDTVALARVLDLEMEGVMADFNRQVSRQLAMNGNALIAKCATTTTSNTVHLDPTEGHDALERGWLAGSSLSGAVIDIGSTSNATSIAGPVTITGATDSTSDPTIVVSGSTISTTNAAYVSMHGSRSGSTSYETNGLGNIVSQSAALGGIAAGGSWQAAFEDSTTTSLTLANLYTGNRQIRQGSGSKAAVIITGLQQEQNIYQQTQAQVRFSSDTAQSIGATDSVKFAGATVYGLPDIKNEQLYMGILDDLLMVSSGDPKWQNEVTGGEKVAWIQGTDSFGGKVTWRLNFGAERRNRWGKFTALT